MGRRPSPPASMEAGPLTVVLSVSLSDGSFNSSVTVPVAATKAEMDAGVARWLEIMQFGLKIAGEVTISQSVAVGGDDKS